MNPAKQSSKKSIIVIVVIVIIAAIVYFYYEGSAGPDSSALSLEAGGNADVVGAQVLGLLNQIQSLKIDRSFFTDPAYQTLRDYSVAIPPQNVGRPNPFAPIPGVSSGGSTGR